MIFVGNGTLLKNAIRHALSRGGKVDYVFSDTDELVKFCEDLNISFKRTSTINDEIQLIESSSSDKIVFSINNGQLFTGLLALPGFRFYNIHNGIVPKYRGLPEICILFAILNNESEYGVSLHEIDKGIDTGRCLDILSFPIEETDNFQSIMLRSIQFCDKIFIKNYENIINDKCSTFNCVVGASKLYTYRDLTNILNFKNHPKFKNATYFGVFRLFYKKLFDILNSPVVSEEKK